MMPLPFANRRLAFWAFQLIGWSGYALMRLFHGIISEEPDLAGYLRFVSAAALIGFVLTVWLRRLYRIMRPWPPALALVSALFICALLGLLFSSLETWAAPYLWSAAGRYEGLYRFANAMFETTVLLAWSAIYFGYQYYTRFQTEKERALKATAAAHQAQLMMLRYQLNPHFLFNTLNAISTLVLEKASNEANEMITKLSAFLRSSLINQPTQKVSVAQELYTLQLYLDIEAVRFQDRLNVVQDIDGDARQALIPSLLLQPLIENAVKYAIAPSETGGSISICVKIAPDGKRLLVRIKDDGPGIPDSAPVRSRSGSGVGIANTRERLQQLYGADHHIILENLSPSGLQVTLDIPLEYARSAAPDATRTAA